MADDLKTERRSRARFPLKLDVQYWQKRTEPGFPGFGRTLNISSTGLLIASEQTVPEGTWLEVAMDWPSLLDGVIPIQLAAQCVVVRSNASSFAVLLSRHQFRTRSRMRNRL
ncbi:MAG TPA: PilZ domain-containing protein [Bryobacteraceae bacterium]|nr:PilZ domain-containing protein [Bryobacteraceae bacterium]